MLAIKACPHVCDKNLSALEDANRFAVLELDDVVEAREVGSEEVDERSGGPIGADNAVYEPAVVFLMCVNDARRIPGFDLLRREPGRLL